MDKDTLYFNIKNTYLQIFDIIIINLQLKGEGLMKEKVPFIFKRYEMNGRCYLCY